MLVDTGEDGEDSEFASRASLYSFKNNAWKESGKGVFKFNTTTVPSHPGTGTKKTGRFIMRAHQTYRLLLNAPVFKEMKVGDSKGNKPSGKSFAFAVIEDGKATPYMVKVSMCALCCRLGELTRHLQLGDSAESEALYHAVQKLQQELD